MKATFFKFLVESVGCSSITAIKVTFVTLFNNSKSTILYYLK